MSEARSRSASPERKAESPSPRPQSSQEHFQTHVKDAFNNLFGEINGIKAALNKLSTETEQSKSQNSRSLPPPPGYEVTEATGTSFSTRQLQDMSEKQRKEIDTLRRELNKKTNENRKLHEIIQADQTEGGLSDEDVDKDFGALKLEIQNFLNRNVKRFRTGSPKLTLNEMKEGAKSNWFAAFIADQLNNLIFNAKLFELKDEGLRRALQTIEGQLVHSEAPRDALASWRAETVKIVRHLEQQSPRDAITNTSDDLFNKIIEYVRFEDEKKTSQELDALCEMAYKLAFALRETKTVFTWHQHPVGNIVTAHYNIHPGYQEPNTSGQLEQYRVMFGPVFKLSGHDLLCIRKGELLLR